MEGQLPESVDPSHGVPGLGGLPRPMETSLQPPPPVQRVMDPGSEQAPEGRLRNLVPPEKGAPASELGFGGSAKTVLRPANSPVSNTPRQLQVTWSRVWMERLQAREEKWPALGHIANWGQSRAWAFCHCASPMMPNARPLSFIRNRKWGTFLGWGGIIAG